MYVDWARTHPHWVSACQRFAETHKGSVAEIARTIGMKNPQTLSNKLNTEQEHELTVAELIAITRATGDETLFDGALLCCGLTAITIPQTERAPSLPHQAIDLNAKVASIGQRALELTDRGRITRSERNTLVSVATSAMGSLAILIHDIEARFQAVPTLACASDILLQAATM
ncbi:phage regulatory CII family protein [Aeromonas sp. sia0103]|uniref:phage regulatory CII family protein n=1 Tax=Aeromonas sp. sia0103 TaxID=2854782 RepID=UPI001C487C99|nr:phage regulatory CII family protein [Aeromonas sp. sia0103]MBV7598011.1 phage regulatory CII family protein [Aeromonas sp. sia0103]